MVRLNLEMRKNAIVPGEIKEGKEKLRKVKKRETKRYPKNWDKNIRKRLKAQEAQNQFIANLIDEQNKRSKKTDEKKVGENTQENTIC
ncbi:hypothetical protein JTB14_016740 [Gonioctena quinquepunctata]|nr:hypothetical protein JTB14_016740 [Gonioctena quinquepunctata]